MSKKSAKNFVDNVEKQLYLSIKEKTESITFKLEKVTPLLKEYRSVTFHLYKTP